MQRNHEAGAKRWARGPAPLFRKGALNDDGGRTEHVLRPYVAAAEEWEPGDVSLEKRFDDVERELIAWSVLVKPAATVSAFAPLPSIAQVRQRLTRLLHHVWQDRWLKAVNALLEQ